MQIYFTEKEHRAFERLMKGKPGFDHYDSKVPGADEDCRTCRSYRPGWKDRFCEYQECPFAPGRSTARASPEGGETKENKQSPVKQKRRSNGWASGFPGASCSRCAKGNSYQYPPYFVTQALHTYSPCLVSLMPALIRFSTLPQRGQRIW